MATSDSPERSWLLANQRYPETRYQSPSSVLCVLTLGVRHEVDVEAMRPGIRIVVDFNLYSGVSLTRNAAQDSCVPGGTAP